MSEPLTPGTWTADPAHSTVGFSVRHLGLSSIRGRFTDFDAALTVGANQTGHGVRATIRAASIWTGVDKRDDHLRSGDFFGTEANPTIAFASTAAVDPGDGTNYTLAGNLTIGATTRPIELAVKLVGQAADPWGGRRAGFLAAATISRAAFGIDFNIALDAGGFVIGDEVTVSLDLQFVAPVDQD